jgi:hypothetical protein|tara:strand:- start:47199 stop:47336 length:138 start_codon:yes stop_codon:yes gene_type:complete
VNDDRDEIIQAFMIYRLHFPFVGDMQTKKVILQHLRLEAMLFVTT